MFKAFCSMAQPGGVGARSFGDIRPITARPFLGFRRYFTLENKICRALFDLAQQAAQGVERLPGQGRSARPCANGRRCGRLGAVRGSLRHPNGLRCGPMANHQIQSPGAEITKRVQRRIWDLQPAGVHPFNVAPMNVHDEIAAVSLPEMVQAVATRVKEAVEFFKSKVPLIAISWKTHAKNWAEKK